MTGRKLRYWIVTAIVVVAGANLAWALGLQLGQSPEELELKYDVDCAVHKSGRVTVNLNVVNRLDPPLFGNRQVNRDTAALVNGEVNVVLEFKFLRCLSKLQSQCPREVGTGDNHDYRNNPVPQFSTCHGESHFRQLMDHRGASICLLSLSNPTRKPRTALQDFYETP